MRLFANDVIHSTQTFSTLLMGVRDLSVGPFSVRIWLLRTENCCVRDFGIFGTTNLDFFDQLSHVYYQILHCTSPYFCGLPVTSEVQKYAGSPLIHGQVNNKVITEEQFIIARLPSYRSYVRLFDSDHASFGRWSLPISISLSRLWALSVCIWYISACSIQERWLKTWGYLIKRHAICAGCVPSEIRHTADLNDIDVTLANTPWNNADVYQSLTIGWKFTTHPYPQINIAEHI